MYPYVFRTCLFCTWCLDTHSISSTTDFYYLSPTLRSAGRYCNRSSHTPYVSRLFLDLLDTELTRGQCQLDCSPRPSLYNPPKSSPHHVIFKLIEFSSTVLILSASSAPHLSRETRSSLLRSRGYTDPLSDLFSFLLPRSYMSY